MRDRTLKDYKRQADIFHRPQVKEVLPEYFQKDYPDLLQFIEYYYEESLEDEDLTVFDDLFAIREIEATELRYLDNIFKEVGAGVSSDLFSNPREMLRSFAEFFRKKGTLWSSEQFFRSFFNEQVEVIYPKKDLFIVSESNIGPESLKVLQNGALYQVLSVLIRSGIPSALWRELYVKLVHPAGFFLGSEVVAEGTGLGLLGAPTVILAEATDIAVTSFATAQPSAFVLAEVTIQIPDGNDPDTDLTQIRRRKISELSGLGAIDFAANYERIAGFGDEMALLDVNSPTFDDDIDSAAYTGRDQSDRGPTGAIRMSNDLETMDFDRQLAADSDGTGWL
jgi:hypothetical protein